MKLDYNVLWIDDRPNQVKPAEDLIRNKLARKGFELQVQKVQEVGSEKTLKKHFNNTDFDLLIVDYKMQKGEDTGDQLIKIIRRFCDVTDIVFYSSDTPEHLRSKINVDGVYCVNRNDLPDKLDSVIHSTLKKALDLNQMRGIFLAAVADFDHAIDELIHLGYDKLPKQEGECKFVNSILETNIKFHDSTKQKLEGLKRDSHISSYTHLLSSSPKYDILNQILTELDDTDIDSYLIRLSDYVPEIIEPRNQLAHAMEKDKRDGVYVLKNKAKEVEFNFDSFTILRTKVLDYKDNFDAIKRIISKI